MVVRKIEKLTDVWIEKGKCQDEDRDVIIYGLLIGIQLAFFTLTVLAVGVALNLVLESIAFLISYRFIRIYAGGFHCKSPVTCYFFSSGIVALVLVIVKFTPIELMQIASMVLLLLSVPAILWLAPIATPNKPLDEVEKKYYRKKSLKHLAIELVLVAMLFSANLERFAFTVCLGIAVTGAVVLLQKLVYVSAVRKQAEPQHKN